MESILRILISPADEIFCPKPATKDNPIRAAMPGMFREAFKSWLQMLRRLNRKFGKRAGYKKARIERRSRTGQRDQVSDHMRCRLLCTPTSCVTSLLPGFAWSSRMMALLIS